MEKDDSLCIGAIMEASAQMRRVTQGIGEMEAYLLYNKDILLAESENDIFRLFFDLAMRARARKYDIEPIKKIMNALIEFIGKMKFYDEKLFLNRTAAYNKYDFDGVAIGDIDENVSGAEGEYEEGSHETVDYLAHILSFGG